MRRIAGLCLTAAAFLAVLFGCTMFPLSLQGRLQHFIDDMNLGQYDLRADAYKNFHPDIALYAAIQGYHSGYELLLGYLLPPDRSGQRVLDYRHRRYRSVECDRDDQRARRSEVSTARDAMFVMAEDEIRIG